VYAVPHALASSDEARHEMLALLGSAQRIDMTWCGGETLRLSSDWVVDIYHTPGHSAGHLSVFDPRSRTMFSGDAVQGARYLDINGAPALCPTYQHVDAYLTTIRAFDALPIDRLASCHWPLHVGPAVKDFLEESHQFVDSVLLDELRNCPDGATLAELLVAAGPRLGGWPRSVDRELVYAVEGHLDRLVARGTIVSHLGITPRRYILSSIDSEAEHHELHAPAQSAAWCDLHRL